MFTLATVLSHTLPPFLWLLTSSFVFSFAIYLPRQSLRLCSLPLLLYFAFKSISVGKQNFGLLDSVATLWTHAVINYVLHVLSLLFIHQRLLVRQAATSDTSFAFFSECCHRARGAYKLWNNPRHMPAKPLDPSIASNQSRSAISRYATFFALNATKLVIYYYVHLQLFPTFFDETIVEIQSQDVSPVQEQLIRRLDQVTDREIVTRAYVASYWVWESFCVIDGSHTLLACFFVLTGLDAPEDWPALFGDPSQATGLRRFWSRFWHTLVVKTYRSYSEVIVNRVGIRKANSPASKTVVTLLIFGISGAVHAAVAWFHGHVSWERNIWWFSMNFVACFLETAFLAATRALAAQLGCTRELNFIADSWLGTFLGYAYVSLFFFWSVPKWKYPALHRQAVRMETITRIFSGMSIVPSQS